MLQLQTVESQDVISKLQNVKDDLGASLKSETLEDNRSKQPSDVKIANEGDSNCATQEVSIVILNISNKQTTRRK